MKKHSLIERIYRAAFKPKQIVIVDAASSKAAKNYSIRPITISLIILTLIIASAWFGSLYLRGHSASNNILTQYIQLQKKLDQLYSQLATSDAQNEVKQAQILSLKKMIEEQQQQINQTQQRLRSFESILQARRSQGTKLVTASITHLTTNTLGFSLTLVKGGNYPRNIRGSIHFITQNHDGTSTHLLFDHKQSTLPFRMETHIFLQGKLYWPDSATIPEHIDSVIAIVSNKKGKELTREKCNLKDL